MVADQSGSFMITTSVHHKLNIFNPYPEKFVQIRVETEDVNENEPVQFRIVATNYGQQHIDKANAEISIYGADDYQNYVSTLYTDTMPIASMQSEEFYANLRTVGLAPGFYQAKVAFHYDGLNQYEQDLFKIGTLLARVTNYTGTASAGKINPFSMNVESRWNNIINEIYATVSLDSLAPVTTPTTTLRAWEQKQFDTFLDLRGIAPGTYEGKITLHYDGHESSYDIELEVFGEHSEAPAATANISENNSEFLSVTNALLIVILLVVLIDLIYMYKKRKNEA